MEGAVYLADAGLVLDHLLEIKELAKLFFLPINRSILPPVRLPFL
jgi:hypothetical protein